jgi:hypothetical protein
MRARPPANGASHSCSDARGLGAGTVRRGRIESSCTVQRKHVRNHVYYTFHLFSVRREPTAPNRAVLSLNRHGTCSLPPPQLAAKSDRPQGGKWRERREAAR